MRRGMIVLTPFPFTDLKGQKVRPGVVVSSSTRTGPDVIIAFVSSVIKGAKSTDLLISTEDPDYAQTGLRVDSVVRLDKLATVSRDIILGRLGDLSDRALGQVNDRLRKALDL